MHRKKTKDPSRIQYSALLLWLGLLLIGAVSCRAEQSELPATQTTELEMTAAPETPESASDQENDDLAASEESQAEELNQCLVCHTDQQTLMDTANPVVATESESSGEG